MELDSGRGPSKIDEREVLEEFVRFVFDVSGLNPAPNCDYF